jgi:hypothetical protein
LRCEAVVHNARALKGKRSLSVFPLRVQQFKGLLDRFRDQLYCLTQAFIADDTLDTLAQHGQVGQSCTTGIHIDNARMRAVMAGVIALALTTNGFTVSQLARQVRTILGLEEDQYLPRHNSYDFNKLRGKQWVHKIENSRRYQPDPQSLMNMTALLTLRDEVIKPVLASAGQPQHS